ncbi:YceI family protein [Pseudotenacibaculum sp. MALMAid0570]|uniref:YceI family protein n=1 Tax=Pseudotenacibaculum sp. MALMAid0570 TaxID=3143938 RepID=UPI0032DED3EF
MNKKLLLFFLVICFSSITKKEEKFIERQGKITFFSYTPVENIQATNTTAQGVLDSSNGNIVVRVLMRAFEFKKSLMYEHFNESYIESDLYPHAILQGKIIDFSPNEKQQTRIVKGDFTLKDVKKPIEVKVNIVKENNFYKIDGNLEVSIKDHNIKVPKVLSANIAKKIQVSFNFQFEPYEN